MGLNKWIQEGFGIWITEVILGMMVIYTLISPSGFFGYLIYFVISIVFLGLSAATMPLSILVYTVLIRPGITIAVRVPLAIVSILIYLFIRTPLHYMGASSAWIWHGLTNSTNNIISEEHKRPKLRYVAVFLTFAFLMLYSFGFDTSTLTSLFRDATFLAIPVVFLPVVLTLVVSSISLKLSGRSLTSDNSSQQKQIDYGATASAAYETGKEAHGLYKDIKGNKDNIRRGAKEHAETAKNIAKKGKRYGSKAGRTADKVVEDKGLSKIAEQLKKIPGLKRFAPSLLEGGAGIAGGTAIAALIVILVALIVIWLIVAAIFIAIFGGVLRYIALPFVGETFGPAIGLGADYATFGGSALGNTAPSFDFTGESNALQLAGARISCALEGPACLQEWQQNNSERPGSESVGVRFGLDIEEFDVNQGNTIDISGRSKDSSIPVTLRVYNTIQGVKGITARDARYRVNIYDGGSIVCSSAEGENDDWSYLGGSFVGDSDADRGVIGPGDFSNPSGQLDDLTLGNCGLLQPGLGEQDVTDAEVEIRYDYSSQSTLSFEAMSEDYRREEGIRQNVDESETANTPVQTFVNVETPVAYSGSGSDRSSEIFTTNIGFQTGRLSTEYRIDVDDFQLDPSSAVIDVDRAEIDRSGYNCEDLTYNDEEQVYKLSESKKDEIISTQNNTWYSQGFAPEASCSMVLDEDEIGSISPTGETLNMRVDGNYTVKTTSSSTSFDTQNTRCASHGFECPLIVPHDQRESKELISRESYPILRSDCDSSWSIQASRNGCTVVENQEEWGIPNILNNDNDFSETINNRETAYLLDELEDAAERPDRRTITRYSHLTDDASMTAVGLREPLEELEESDDSWVVEAPGEDGVEASVRTFDRVYCDDESSDDILEDLRVSGPILASIKTTEDVSDDTAGPDLGVGHRQNECITTD